MNLTAIRETLEGEGLKTAAEETLHLLGQTAVGRDALERYAFGPGSREVDLRLATTVAGIDFEHPVMVGAGWDKKGRAILGLHALGFAGVEVGTVPLFGQYGNPKPRLWTIDDRHSVGLNRLGFNSLGAERVAANLSQHGNIPFPLGVNIGLNKLMPPDKAPWAHAAVLEHVAPYADYIALGISSPNTKHVRDQQNRAPLTELTQEVMGIMKAEGYEMPLLYKVDGDRTDAQLYDIIEVARDNGVAGIIAINTTVDTAIKKWYGERWAKEMGGLSGADDSFRRKSVSTIRFIYEEAGDQLVIIGAGGAGDTETAMDKLEAGASLVQVVTAIRPSWGRVAANIVGGMPDMMDRDGVRNISEYVGIATHRGHI